MTGRNLGKRKRAFSDRRPFTLRAVVDRIEDGRWAVFTVAGGGEMTLAVKHLPQGLREGQAFDVLCRPNAAAERALRSDVRRLQKELLKRSGRAGP